MDSAELRCVADTLDTKCELRWLITITYYWSTRSAFCTFSKLITAHKKALYIVDCIHAADSVWHRPVSAFRFLGKTQGSGSQKRKASFSDPRVIMIYAASRTPDQSRCLLDAPNPTTRSMPTATLYALLTPAILDTASYVYVKTPSEVQQGRYMLNTSPAGGGATSDSTTQREVGSYELFPRKKR
ncbi:hypothetical protein GQ600_25169 [Phytophthora cactorum]|nr:hypothetical protein GQ600_25169 [Phytophthora cactorum]